MCYDVYKDLTMKIFFITLSILFLATPAFCAPGWKEGANDNVKFYDDSEFQAYARKLEENYYKKYFVKISPTESVDTSPLNAWNSEVEVPIFQYMIEHPTKYVNR